MRITDLPVATPLSATARATAKKAENNGSAPSTVLTSGARADSAQHPDEVAAAALQKAANAAQVSRVVAAENQRASDSVRGDIDPGRVVVLP